MSNEKQKAVEPNSGSSKKRQREVNEGLSTVDFALVALGNIELLSGKDVLLEAIQQRYPELRRPKTFDPKKLSAYAMTCLGCNLAESYDVDEIQRRQEECTQVIAAREAAREDSFDDEIAEDGYEEDMNADDDLSQLSARPTGVEWKKKDIRYKIAFYPPENYASPVLPRKELLKSGLPKHVIDKINQLDFEDTKAGRNVRDNPTHRKINEDANKEAVTICWMSQQYPLEGDFSTTPAPGVECEMCVHRREQGEEVACFYFATSRLIHLAV